MALKDDIQKLITGEILDDDETLKKYSRDSSIFEIRPTIVIFPKNSEDIKAIVNYVNQNKDLSITVRSAGTDMSGAAIGESIILDVSKYINKLININEDSAIVQPGKLTSSNLSCLQRDLHSWGNGCK